MRTAMIMAGGLGTRLWPMSRVRSPKQLIPFIHGKSLLQLAVHRLEGLLAPEEIVICAGQGHAAAILKAIPTLSADRFYGEPMGRDTLNAVGLVAAEICARAPDTIMGVFTADHVIEPVDQFQQIVAHGFEIVEAHPNALVTFGINPTHAATAYGYLELGRSHAGGHNARVVDRFKEKPDAETAQRYLEAGSSRYLWNSGMFVWRASTLMRCIQRYAPENYRDLTQLGEQYQTDRREAELHRIYPKLKKISIDYAVMEPASQDPDFQVVAMPMPLTWLDVGSWPAFGSTCPRDEHDNALASERHVLLDTRGTLVASSDPDHLVAAIGCDNLIIVHTPDATLVCRADQAEKIKQVHEHVGQHCGEQWL